MKKYISGFLTGCILVFALTGFAAPHMATKVSLGKAAAGKVSKATIGNRISGSVSIGMIAAGKVK